MVFKIFSIFPEYSHAACLLISFKSSAIVLYVGVRLCCLLPSHRNNFDEDQVRAVEKWTISSTP